MSRFFAAIMLVVMLGSAAPIQAQTDAVELTTEPEETESLLECFDFYQPGNITARYTASPLQVAPNEPVTFSGSIINNHLYPLVDVNVYAKVLKRNETTAILGLGDTVVEQIEVMNNQIVPAGSVLPFEYVWTVPAASEGGEYYASIFIATAEGDYPVMGATLFSDTLSNQVDFTVVHDGSTPNVYIDRAALLVDGVSYTQGNIPEIDTAADTVVTVPIVNPTDQPKTLPVQWQQYTAHTAVDERLVASKTTLVTVPANGQAVLNYTIPAGTDGPVHLTALMQDGTARQFVNVTLNRDGLRVVAPQATIASLSAFPLKANEPVTLFTCLSTVAAFQSPAGTDVALTLTTADGAIIHEFTDNVLLTQAVSGYGVTFTPIADYESVILKATVTQEQNTILASELTYDCAQVGTCATSNEPVTTVPTESNYMNMVFILLGGLLLIIIAAITIAATRRKKTSPMPLTKQPSDTLLPSLIILVALSLFASVIPTTTQAQTAFQAGNTCVWEYAENQVAVSGCPQVRVPACDSLTPPVYSNMVGQSVPSGAPVRCQVGCTNEFNGSTVYVEELFKTNCVAGVPSPSATISGSGCTIASGASTCNGSVTWTISNASTPNVFNSTRNLQHSTSPSGSGSAIALTNGANTIQARNGATVLQATSLSASCVGGTTWNGSICAAPPPPPPPQSPIGSFDAATASNCTVAGWTFDQDNSSASIDIHVYRDGPAGSGTFVTSCTANGSRPDVNSAYGITGNHGFNCFLPAAYTSLGNRNLYIHAIDTNGGSNNVIGGSPKALNCTPPAATISVTNCTIPAGGSSCNGLATWNITNGTSPNARNNTSGVQFSTSASGNNVAVTLSYGSNTVVARNSSTVLATANPSASCVSGTTWNGGQCVATPPPPPTVSATISGSGCTIAANAMLCNNGSVTWNIQNASAPNVRHNSASIEYSTNPSGTAPVSMTHGTITIVARDGNTILASANLTATCASGTAWDGSTCAPPTTPGSCAAFGLASMGWQSATNPADVILYQGGSAPNCLALCNAAMASRTGSWNCNYASQVVGMQYGFVVPDVGLSNGSNVYSCRLSQQPLTYANPFVFPFGGSWSGTSCTAPVPPPAATISGTGCTIAAGASTCNGAATWSITNATSPNVRNTTTGTQYSTNPIGSGAVVALQQGTNTIVARDNTTALATTNLSATCVTGTTWNGSTCALPIVPDIDLKINGSDGPVTVTVGQTLNLTWTGTAVTGCTKWGGTWGSGQAIAVPGSASVAATVSDNYFITCAQDSDTVVVNVLPVPTATLEMNINGGAWTGANQTVNPTDVVRLRWSSTNATSCSGTNFNTSGAANNATGVVATLPAPGASQTYSISCTGAGGTGNDSIMVTNRQLPNLSTPIINLTPSGTYDTVTGTYDSVIVDFGTSNNGGSPTGAVVPYRFEFDRGNNGYEENATGQFAALNNGASANTSRSATNVPFGSATVRITVDHTNSISESNESDNVATRTITLSPPAPNLELEVSPSFVVRSGDIVSLTWDVNATYPMTCTVAGPAFTTVTFDPSVDGPTGSAQTGPITTQSNYSLTCTEPNTSTTFPPAEIVVETVGSVEEI